MQDVSLSFVRSFLLFLSRRRHLRKWLETSSAARRLAARFVAGETLEDALRVSRKLNSEGITVTLDHLGESVSTLEEAAAARDVYLKTLSAIHDSGIQGNVSLKLTQFGLDISGEQCRANVEQLVRSAAGLGSFVRVDMESSEYTGRTLKLVEDLHARYGAVGVVIQSYLYRSRDDVETLCARAIRVRLCKGAYLEPPSVAFEKKGDVDSNFVELTRILLDRGSYPAIATHDERMIEAAKAYAKRKAHRAGRVRVPDAVRHPAGSAGATRLRWLPGASVRAFRQSLVSLLHASSGGAAGQRRIHAPQPFPVASNQYVPLFRGEAKLMGAVQSLKCMRYWAFFAGKLAAAAGTLYGLLALLNWFWPPEPRFLSLPAASFRLRPGIHAGGADLVPAVHGRVVPDHLGPALPLPGLPAATAMPVETGSWSRMLQFGRPRIEYICPYGHGTLKEDELQISGLEGPEWTAHSGGLWEEL